MKTLIINKITFFWGFFFWKLYFNSLWREYCYGKSRFNEILLYIYIYTVITRLDVAFLEPYLISKVWGGTSRRVLHFGVKKIKIGPKLRKQ